MNSTPQDKKSSVKINFQYEDTNIYITEKLLSKWVKKSINTSLLYSSYICNKIRLNIRMVNEKEIKELNRNFRKKNNSTNVITFEYGIENGYLMGDIIICLPVVEKEAIQQKKNFLDHAAHITIHGVLHALGFDHSNNEDAVKMEALEIEILNKFNIRNPYL
ncbi:rRNA maturation RNase YbeY [Candidatus Kinetoplastidibacterium galati]|uniref:Endoribonuclease YbeY n=1 Tax=Candidatus Kinetoplastidibacterium galati TCC219 TaxID=1208921 RepID=M1LXP9_9PROT|nr:rRNA maturation RNase YbeY [Candidatus Kinetoplastibacterium galatii]AGF48836.1 putative metal-dependent hydrolase [Candidatus Kinetoplastibacterium galatii TCC219]